jgi:hypothetical protein
VTTPSGPGFDWYIVELGLIANQCAEEYPADKRWPTFVETVGRISAGWNGGIGTSIQVAQDITSVMGQAEALKANYPTASNVDILLRYAQAIMGIYESDILNED